MDLKIIKIIDFTDTIRLIRIKLEEEMKFKPGQFILLSKLVDGKICRRAYSISSSPLEKEYIEICVNLHPTGKLTPELFKLKEGEIVDIKGPFGVFTFDEEKEKSLVLISGGTGITPNRSIIKYCTQKKLDTKITLFYGARNPKYLVFADEMRKLFEQNPNLNIFFTVDHYAGMEFDGREGILTFDFVNQYVKDLAKHTYYICGPNIMINNMTHDLEEHGVSHNQIKIDKW